MLTPDEVIDGKFRIVRLLGQGGMGAVYEGVHLLIHRRVAIKVLHAAVVQHREAALRFEREAQAAGRIGSKHIVEVLDLGQLPSGARYMVMEFLEGESLGTRLERQHFLSPVELYPIVTQLLDGLGAAHRAGIVHRDLKPDNVFLQNNDGKADFVKLLDFGISKFGDSLGDSGLSMTQTGAVMGTPFYMAPEQARGARAVDHRADIYAAGVIMYECLTGRVPFNASSFNELLFKIALEEPPPLRSLAPHVDEELAGIVARAMARDPGRRFQSAAELRAALDGWSQRADPVRAREKPDLQLSATTLPAEAGAALGGGRQGGGTTATWSQSSQSFSEALELVNRRRRGRRIAIGVVLAVGAAVAAVALLVRGNPEPVRVESLASAAASAAASTAAAELAAREAARLEAERAERERREALAEAERRRAAEEQEARRLLEEQQRKEQERAAAQRPRPRRAEPVAIDRPRPAVPPPAPPAPAATPTRTAAPEPSARPPRTTIGDRPIRTTL